MAVPYQPILPQYVVKNEIYFAIPPVVLQEKQETHFTTEQQQISPNNFRGDDEKGRFFFYF